ncbi:MAG: hypothetical protein QW334_04890, partial [Thermofilum sp.]
MTTGPPPLLITSLDGTKTNDNTPCFTWDNTNLYEDRPWQNNVWVGWAADNWEIWIDNSPTFDNSGGRLRIENVAENFFTPPELGDENYFWRVRGWHLGFASAFTPTWSFLVDTVKPTTPIQSEVYPDTGVDDPHSNTTTNVNDIQFTWSISTDSSNSPTGEKSGIRYYEIIIDNDNFAPPYLHDNFTTNNYITLYLPEGTWQWIVRAWDWAGNVSENNVPWKIIIDQTPPAPPNLALATPENRTKTKSTGMYFDWPDSSDPSGIWYYWFQLDNDPNFTLTHHNKVNVSSLTQSIRYVSFSSPTDELYYWRVKVEDKAGNWSDWSGINWILIDTVAPSIPVKTGPENNENFTSATVFFSFQESTDASGSPTGERADIWRYQLQIDNNLDFSSPENDVYLDNITNTFQTYLADGVWYWRVSAWDWAGNQSGWGTPWMFTVDNNPPPAPTLKSPVDGKITNDNTPFFEWTRVYDVTGVSYEIWIDNSPTFDNSGGKLFIDNTDDNFYTMPIQLSDENYFWKVRAWDGKNWPLARRPGAFSDTWSILIDTRPPPAPTYSPAIEIAGKPYAGDGLISRDNKLYIHWNRVTDISFSPTGETAGTTMYEIHVDNDNDFSSVDYICFSTDNIFNYLDENWPAATGFPEGNYSFKVFAWDAAGNRSESSPVWTFIVDVTPPPPPNIALAKPENNGAENTVSGEFVVVIHDWPDVYDSSGIDHYEIQVDNEPTYSEPCPPPGIFGSDDFNNISSSTITIYYPKDGKYWWRVRAVDRSGLTGEWSDNLVFIVDRVPPLTPTPLHPIGITTSDNTPY